MRKVRFFVILLSCFAVMLPVMAQDEDPPAEATEEPVIYDCTTAGINLQVDSWYNDYLADRGEFDEAQALAAAQTLADNLNDLTTGCATQSVAEDDDEVIEQTGIGTVDAPFIIQAAGIVGDSTLNITQSILPANDVIAEQGISGADIIPEGQEYLLLAVELTCRSGSTTGCSVTENSFRVTGVKGNIYTPALSQIDDYFPTSRRVNGGDTREGVIPFLVDADDTGLQLIYYPNDDATTPGAFATYFDATGSATQFALRATTAELLIRNRPVSGAPVGVLRDEQEALALGRNEDSTWVYVEAPEGTGWVSADFIEADVEISELSVIDPDEVQQ